MSNVVSVCNDSSLCSFVSFNITVVFFSRSQSRSGIWLMALFCKHISIFDGCVCVFLSVCDTLSLTSSPLAVCLCAHVFASVAR